MRTEDDAAVAVGVPRDDDVGHRHGVRARRLPGAEPLEFHLPALFLEVGFEQLLLFRTLENTRGVTITGEQLAEEVYPSVVFFQDTYHLNIEQIFISGLPQLGGAAPVLRAQTGAEVRELVSAAQLGSSVDDSVPLWRMAGVVGALVS